MIYGWQPFLGDSQMVQQRITSPFGFGPQTWSVDFRVDELAATSFSTSLTPTTRGSPVLKARYNAITRGEMQSVTFEVLQIAATQTCLVH